MAPNFKFIAPEHHNSIDIDTHSSVERAVLIIAAERVTFLTADSFLTVVRTS